ncbi:MAG: hypothetical protein JWM71_1197 [Solirubrobacteraceae bacterium]|nr:hypothetical protein [Solirubrobacteraceae bacterium]
MTAAAGAPQTTVAPAVAKACPPWGRLILLVNGMRCADARRIADAMGPSSAHPHFTVRGFACVHVGAQPVRCTRGAERFSLSGGD